MTINQTIDQVYGLSVLGYFNDIKFSMTEFLVYIKKMFADPKQKNVYIQIALPDGKWMMKITRYSDKPDGYDYYIPDDRAAESILIKEMVNGGAK